MTHTLQIVLTPSPAQAQRLKALQAEFAAVCNAIVPIAQAQHCWNRVRLHHLTYHDMRQRFPLLGSQMVCNAIYSVSRTYRLILSHPDSPWSKGKRSHKHLPLLRFQADSPVYFDRHTLSLRKGQLSMFTLDGRMQFQLGLSPGDQQRFLSQKLREVILMQTEGHYVLQFWFDQGPVASQEDKSTDQGKNLRETVIPTHSVRLPLPSPGVPDPSAETLPDYVQVLAPEQATTTP